MESYEVIWICHKSNNQNIIFKIILSYRKVNICSRGEILFEFTGREWYSLYETKEYGLSIFLCSKAFTTLRAKSQSILVFLSCNLCIDIHIQTLILIYFVEKFISVRNIQDLKPSILCNWLSRSLFYAFSYEFILKQ